MRLHPVDPGIEVMLAKIAYVASCAGGGKLDFPAFLINTVKQPAADKAEGEDFAAFLHARVKAKDGDRRTNSG